MEQVAVLRWEGGFSGSALAVPLLPQCLPRENTRCLRLPGWTRAIDSERPVWMWFTLAPEAPSDVFCRAGQGLHCGPSSGHWCRGPACHSLGVETEP